MAELLPALTLPFVERLYADYLREPGSVPGDWRRYFESLDRAEPSLHAASGTGGCHRESTQDKDLGAFQCRIDDLIEAYRMRGHMVAHLDPLGGPKGEPRPELDPAHYGLTAETLDRSVSTPSCGTAGICTVRQLLDHLKETYCRTIGAEFMHIDEPDVRHWIQERMEATEGHVRLTTEQQLRVLTLLTRAVVFEEFVRKRYIGAKSFSLEGCESLIPLLDTAIERAATHGVEEIVLGMAHRGRLNVLVNIVGKRSRDVFREFEDADSDREPQHGDLRFHLGYSSDRNTAVGRPIHLSLCFNPSHLEFVDPVVAGRVRAKQDRRGDEERRKVLAILLHGDAAFPAEGIVQETLNLSGLAAYRIGGTLHVIVNNQIGFTTPPDEARSSCYATAVAKMLQIPIFHVNGEDPEAVTHVVNLSMDFCRLFQRDVIIDLYGYRRHGHNEADEPSFTQPLMYRVIRERPSVRDGYLENMLKLGGVTREQADDIAAECREALQSEWSAVRDGEDAAAPADGYRGIWEGYHGGLEAEVPDIPTAVDEERLTWVLEKLTDLPESFHLHPLLRRAMERRREMAAGRRPLDWSSAEALAFAALALEGRPVRLTGQDTARGTFGQRHAILYDAENGSAYEPLADLSPDQASVTIRNSPLSEAGALGFEYGYSLDSPDGLVLWEAQFGDFANAAQVIIDQFIASAEAKWRRLSGLVLLLPHGWDGQGPEHTSARLERFLALAAEDNIQIVNASTPAQYFHVLRRQVLRPWRKPLVIMTPKSLLRHPKAVSTLEQFTHGSFERVIADDAVDPASVQRILLCSGKIYYELAARRDELLRTDVAIVRVEQLYPFPDGPLNEALSPYRAGTQTLWVQEEPENMGAWRFLRSRCGETLYGRLPLRGVYRPSSPTPATGSSARHKREQEELLQQSFAALPERARRQEPIPRREPALEWPSNV